MFFLQRQSEAVDDRAEDFEQFSDTIMSFCVVNEVEEDVIHRATYECSKIEEFAIYAMQSGFKEVSFAWIFAIKQIQELDMD